MDLGIMPDLRQRRCHYQHTTDSALESLYRLGVTPRQVTIRIVGTGWKKHTVVDQHPAPGTPLHASSEIQLFVSGLPLFQTLPYGMRESAGDVPSTGELTALLDDPIEKFRHAVDNPATMFDLREDRPETCERFIKLFKIDPAAWPKKLWFRLATFLPSLHRVAGTEKGIRRALWIFVELEVFRIYTTRRTVAMAREEWSKLGSAFSRLGVDLVAGQRIADFEGIILVLGPVTLDHYFEFQERRQAALLRQVLELVLPFHLAGEGESLWIRWQVGDPASCPWLGLARKNSVLGVNSHLGTQPQSL